MLKTLTFVSAALLGFGVTTGATAADNKTQTADTVTNSPAVPASDDQGGAKEKRYCVVDTVTGSRIPQKVCKTRKAWIAENGFDPLNP